jgi:putative salt-induced outer membrane protein YdiY
MKFINHPQKITIFAIILFLLTPVSASAIVNMEGLHFKNIKKDFNVDLDFKVSGSTGNSKTSTIALDGQLSWINENYINLAIFGKQFGKNNGIESTNKSFAHFRHIHKITSVRDWELFTQVEQNKFTRLTYRGLLGAGLRHNLFDSGAHQAFLGAGAFYTKEETAYVAGLTDDGTETYTRANFYFLSKYKITSNIDFTNTLYYQPRFSDTSDYRALLQSKFDFKLSDNLKLRLSIDVEHDSKPSQTIEKTDMSYLTGLVVNF